MNKIYANPVGIIKKDIYVIKNDINDKVYVGQTKDIVSRFASHCKKNPSLLSQAIQEYGKEHFWYEILESQVENYNEREIYWISKLNCQTPNGYNIMAGGDLPPVRYEADVSTTVLLNPDVEKLKDDLANTNLPLSQLAKKYNISKKQVLRINQGISRGKLNETYPIRAIPNINGKLTDEDVDIIIELLRYTYQFTGDIARRFNVDVHAISRINAGLSHRREDIEYPIRKWKSCGVIQFTYEQVTDIIKDLQTTDLSLHKIAKKYGVNVKGIKLINSGKSKKYKRDDVLYPIRPF